MKIIIYTTPTCHYCSDVKDFLNEHGFKYEVKDVAKDLGARQEMKEKSGQLGVPVTIIEDKIIVGFDKDSLGVALKLHE